MLFDTMTIPGVAGDILVWFSSFVASFGKVHGRSLVLVVMG